MSSIKLNFFRPCPKHKYFFFSWHDILLFPHPHTQHYSSSIMNELIEKFTTAYDRHGRRGGRTVFIWKPLAGQARHQLYYWNSGTMMIILGFEWERGLWYRKGFCFVFCSWFLYMDVVEVKMVWIWTYLISLPPTQASIPPMNSLETEDEVQSVIWEGFMGKPS